MTRTRLVVAIILGVLILLAIVGGLFFELGNSRRSRLDVLLAEQLTRLRELPVTRVEHAAAAATEDPEARERIRRDIELELQDLIAGDDLVAKRAWLLDRYRFIRGDVIRQRDGGEIDAAIAAPVIARCDELIAELERH